MIQLDILAVGNLVRDDEGRILEANSTSVLIRAEGRLIVVDPSTTSMRPAVKTSFKREPWSSRTTSSRSVRA